MAGYDKTSKNMVGNGKTNVEVLPENSTSKTTIFVIVCGVHLSNLVTN
jgi:hypothetical protein